MEVNGVGCESTRQIVLYGVGSPLVIDAEESCTRAGITIVVGVRNVDAPVYVTGTVRVITPGELSDAERECPVLVVLFTPGHRRAAFEEAFRAGLTQMVSVIDPTSIVAHSATIGAGSVVLPEVEIGDNAVIAAGSVVRRSVPPHTLAAGTFRARSVVCGVMVAAAVASDIARCYRLHARERRVGDRGTRAWPDRSKPITTQKSPTDEQNVPALWRPRISDTAPAD